MKRLWARQAVLGPIIAKYIAIYDLDLQVSAWVLQATHCLNVIHIYDMSL